MSESEEATHNAKVISFINMKGGVGKTTLCIGLATCMSDTNKKVLVIDADPQFNATQSLLDDYKKKETSSIVQSEIQRLNMKMPDEIHTEDDVDEIEFSYYSKKVLDQSGENSSTIYRLFQQTIALRHPFEMPGKEILTSLNDNLDLLCGDLSLVLANKTADYNLSSRIKRFIKINKLKEDYDYILIDCPPTLTIYTDAALLASDYYVIPNRIDRYSIIGIDSLEKSIDNLFDESDTKLPCLGIIYTMVPTNMGKKQKKIQYSFESKKVVTSLDIFSTISHKVDAIQSGRSGTNPMSYASSRSDIQAIFSELQTRIEESQQ